MPSKEEYLKRYLEPEKKKKKKKVKSRGNLTVKDTDVGWDEMKVASDDDGPTIAAVIDDRPEELRKKQDGWKGIGTKSKADKSPKRRPRVDSDESPTRSSSNKKKLNKSRDKSDSDESPARNTRKRADSDESPPRNTRRRADSDNSPPRKNRKRFDSDGSPPRRTRVDSDESPPRNRRARADSDESPPRRRARVDSDESPPRRSNKPADSDESPPRRRARANSDESPPRRRDRADSDASPQRNPLGDDSPKRMQDGGKAGINTKSDFKTSKGDKFKNSNMAKIIEDAKNQETVYREKGTGKKRNFEKEHEETEAERKRKEEELKNYKVWNKGKVQLAQREENIASYMRETEKPLARYKDDEDYNRLKKDEMHAEDPMYAYVMKNKRVGSSSTKKSRARAGKPIYSGGVANTNRFNIRPGYRWDGCDRGTGYETKYFEYLQKCKQNKFDAWRANTDDF